MRFETVLYTIHMTYRREFIKKVRYHGSWTHLSEKADSRRSGRNACHVEYNRPILHTPVLPVHTAAELVETERAGLMNDLRKGKKKPN